CLSVYFFFFFSSRRRHTRFSRDWSSDVCSSDLARAPGVPFRPSFPVKRDDDENEPPPSSHRCDRARHMATAAHDADGADPPPSRSEERRVGKECRSRWWTSHEK